jgi:predicted dehydrogenase
MGASPPYRVVQIGAGRFSRRAHGPALQRLAAGPDPIVRLEGICDLDAARPDRAGRFAHDFGHARCFSDVQRMIDDAAPDLIVCSVPPRWTPAVLRTLLPRGIAIFTEKPPARSAREAIELAELAARVTPFTYVAFNRRRMPAVEFAERWVRETDRLVRIRAQLLRVDRREPDFLITTGIHAIDTLRYLGGEASAVASTSSTPRHGCGRNYDARLRFETGVTGDLQIRVDAAIDIERYTLHCDTSIVDVSVCAPYSDASLWAGVRVYRGSQIEMEQAADRDWLIAAGIIDEHLACVRSLADGVPPDCGLADASRSMTLADSIERRSNHHGTRARVRRA